MQGLITIVAAIFVFGVVIFIHEFGHFITAKTNKICVLEFSIGMGPSLFSKQFGETLYSLRLLPIGGFCLMEGEEEESASPRAFNNAKTVVKLLVLVAGVTMNFILGLLLLGGLTIAQDRIPSTTIAGFYEQASTQASGLEVGDTIVSINGTRLLTADDIFYEMMWVKDGKCDMTVIRNGEKTKLSNIQFQTEGSGDGLYAITLDFYVQPMIKTPLSVLGYSARWALSLVRQILRNLVQLITGVVPINQLSGPVGIISAIGEAASYGIESVLILMAFISINLGVMNLLPFPALDGGKILITLIESVFHKKLGEKAEIALNIISFGIIILLMLFVTYNDILRIMNQ